MIVHASNPVAYWKAIDAGRLRWNRRIAALAGDVFRAERARIVPAVRALGSIADIEHAVRGILISDRQRWQRFYVSTYQQVGDEFAARTVAGLQRKASLYTGPVPLSPWHRKSDPLKDAAGELVDRWRLHVLTYVRQIAGIRIRDIEQATLNKVRARIELGIAEGASIEEIARALDDLYLTQIIPNRSMVIARTEVIAASNAGSQAGARSTGLALLKLWIATPGPRTRPAHASAWGQKQKLDDPYVVMGEKLMHPGDGSQGASARNLVNCRCTEGYEPDPDAPADESSASTNPQRGPLFDLPLSGG